MAFFISAAILLGAFLVKLPGTIRHWRSPDAALLRAVSGLLLVAAAVFVLAAPASIAAVNRYTGIANVAAPVVYATLIAFCGSCLVLIITWRGDQGRPGSVRFWARWTMGIYIGVIVAIVTLFVLGDASEERLRDLDTYYASTPYIREMIVLYLTAHTVAVVVSMVLCLHWSRQISGWLRRGVWMLVAGFAMNLVYDTLKFAAVFARWSGRDWDELSSHVAVVFASLSAFLIGVGFVLPLLGEAITDRLQAASSYRRLRPLWSELRTVSPGPPASLPRRASLDERLTHREMAIYDGLLALAQHFDWDVRDRTYRQAQNQGLPNAQDLADAAMLVTAVQTKELLSGTHDDSDEIPAPLTISGTENLVRISRALHSPIVAAARHQAAAAGTGTNVRQLRHS
ncbi:MAB_1171c family putative transporter [Streptomyces sp. E11-3]|uniref:MAB_1171c family putative transporter n=1 Tax=Streptomyces sp. E11-3 TaxID=3110112 RepID=UPI0039813DF5